MTSSLFFVCTFSAKPSAVLFFFVFIATAAGHARIISRTTSVLAPERTATCRGSHPLQSAYSIDAGLTLSRARTTASGAPFEQA
eukprot:CAMPEP_0172544360 /NCGR_PEP_ID=MMETSP1067-20121228/14538_1 /TAXON_ID=265564 ORGANISM="Thalassiosira punctigera, Strain Tpunct2005C2" /NCGR_SAMPLE_ID=MMETSP1067 /ASSEMBLY_ACC=CAM_ASM_000444 /LENGTH=83 /DNA_ID=CAMNT_0013330909 /DNA_START=1 /DNA_END=252 /DNA_ORIENTATION=-